jgi:hypothetical protein
MLRELSADELEKLFDSLQSDPLPGVSLPRHNAILTLLCEQWGRLDHETAIAHILNQPVEIDHGASLSAVVNGWAQVDPEAAVKWLRKKFEVFPAGRFRAGSAVRAAYQQWALRDPQGALASLPFTYENGMRSKSAMDGITKILKLPEHRGDLIAAIEQMPDEGLRTDAINAAIDPLGFTAAADWIEKMELGGKERKSIRHRLMGGWAQRDPRAAGEWLLKTGRPDERAKVIERVVGSWSMKDVNSAAEWVTELGLGPDTDGAVASLVRAYSRDSPENAFRWALHITTEKERFRSLGDALVHWRAKEPEVAMKSLVESGISEDEIHLILQRVSE